MTALVTSRLPLPAEWRWSRCQRTATRNAFLHNPQPRRRIPPCRWCRRCRWSCHDDPGDGILPSDSMMWVWGRQRTRNCTNRHRCRRRSSATTILCNTSSTPLSSSYDVLHKLSYLWVKQYFYLALFSSISKSMSRRYKLGLNFCTNWKIMYIQWNSKVSISIITVINDN